MMRRSLIRGGVLAMLLASQAFAMPATAQDARWEVLREDQFLTDGLVLIAIGRRIVKGCEAIDAARARAFFHANGLMQRARDKGFSTAEINEFIKDEFEKARIDALSDAWLASKDTNKTDAEGLCRVGLDEIARATPLGRMLRTK